MKSNERLTRGFGIPVDNDLNSVIAGLRDQWSSIMFTRPSIWYTLTGSAFPNVQSSTTVSRGNL